MAKPTIGHNLQKNETQESKSLEDGYPFLPNGELSPPWTAFFDEFYRLKAIADEREAQTKGETDARSDIDSSRSPDRPVVEVGVAVGAGRGAKVAPR